MRRRRPVPAIVTVALLLAGCAAGGADDGRPVGTSSFDVPIYDWDGASAMEALVSGRLSCTDDGCTLLSHEGEGLGSPVLFPNAVGIEFDNGLRAVADESTGAVFAVEGEEFSYGGGHVGADESWTESCGGDAYLSVALINDEPAGGVPTEEPDPVAADLPDRVGTLEERGYFEVPTYPLGPDDSVMESHAEGTIHMTVDGCPVFGSSESSSGLVLPNAIGRHTDDGPVVIWETGSAGVSTMGDGDDRGWGGGPADERRHAEVFEQWEELCPANPAESLWLGY